VSDRKGCDCGESCSFAGIDGPCWGAREVVDEWHTDDDHGWVHECEAHEGYNSLYGPHVYKPQSGCAAKEER
jgi:hypothetical protein